MKTENTYKPSNLQLLNWMSKYALSLNDFYDVSFCTSGLYLIGKYRPELALNIQNALGEHDYNEVTKELTWSTSNINIILEL
jgi:hypothetical protein